MNNLQLERTIRTTVGFRLKEFEDEYELPPEVFEIFDCSTTENALVSIYFGIARTVNVNRDRERN